MKRLIIAAALVLAACGQSGDGADTETTAAPQTLFDQAQAMDQIGAAVFANQQFMAHAGELDPPCTQVRETVSRGIIPDTIGEDSAYRPYVGSMVYAVQCGELRTNVRPVVSERWMLVISPGADAPVIAPCLTEDRTDGCLEIVNQAARGGAPKQE